MSRIAIMALEGIEEEGVVAETPVEEVVIDTTVQEIAEQPENEMMEMSSAVNELENLDSSSDEAMQTAGTLNEIKDQMGESLETGGLEEPAAAALELAVEHMCKRIGFPPKRTGFALEAFKSRASRISATKTAMETIGEMGAKIWAAIVNMFEKAIEWAQTFFDRFITGAGKFAKRAEDIIAVASKLDGKSAAAGTKIEAKGMAKYLVSDNKLLTGDAFVNMYKKSNANSLVNRYEESVKTIATITEKALEVVGDTYKFQTVVSSLDNDRPIGAITQNKEEEKEGMVVYEDKIALGNMSLYTTTFPPEATASEIEGKASKLTAWVAASAGAKAFEEDTSIDALNAVEILNVAKAAKEHMDKYVAGKAEIQQIKALQTSVMEKAKQLSKSADKGSDTAKNSTAAATLSKYIIRVTTTTISQIRSHDLNVTKAALDYCSASIAAINGKKPEAKAE